LLTFSAPLGWLAQAAGRAISSKFDCTFDPVSVVSLALGAHTGSSVVGLTAGDLEMFSGLFKYSLTF
jgi:hypothetical protein